MGFDLGDYKDVAQRIADFKAKHPEGCLRPANAEQPYDVVTIGSQFFIVYAAAAYRTPDDPTPGIGVAWEPFPGKTSYTKDSELQNAETSAWGRAIVAVLASESKSVASAEDVRNRQADAEVKPLGRYTTPDGELIEVWPGEVWVKDAKARVVEACGGDKTVAAELWAASDLADKWKVTDDQLAALVATVTESLSEGEGAAPSATGTAPDTPGALTAFEEQAEAMAARAAEEAK